MEGRLVFGIFSDKIEPMKRTLLLLLICTFISTIYAKEKLSKADEQSIRLLMNKQEEAWNAGNIDQFMETYWNSPDLVFVGSGGPVYGWQQTLDRYKKNYPTKVAMGKLSFDLLSIASIDTRTAFLIGKFHLSREVENLNGCFTLVLQKIDEQWFIISDHSSAEN